MKTFFSTVLTLLVINSCNNMKELEPLKNYKSLELCELGTEAQDTVAGKKYIEGYEVIESYVLNERQSKQIIKELLNSDNYEKETRRCKLEPAYAINSQGKLLVLFELEYCPKLEFYGTDSIVRLDIATENTIKKIIESIKTQAKK